MSKYYYGEKFEIYGRNIVKVIKVVMYVIVIGIEYFMSFWKLPLYRIWRIFLDLWKKYL